jgi:adenosine kinase
VVVVVGATVVDVDELVGAVVLVVADVVVVVLVVGGVLVVVDVGGAVELVLDEVVGVVVLVLDEVEVLVVTRGEQGCTVLSKDARHDVPAVPPVRIADPTGVGDAFRGGFMKGLATGVNYEECAKLGSVAATYALEHLGGTSHTYSLEEFKARFLRAYGG